MRVTTWGTRGSIATPGPRTARYGGNTACVSVEGEDGTMLVLDAGTGIRVCGTTVPTTLRRIDVLLTHLHMDHIIGLGFFQPLRRRGIAVHIWGPAGASDLRRRLARYLSPPLFPISLRDLPAEVVLHEICDAEVTIGGLHVSSAFVTHPDPALGYRIGAGRRSIVYLPDHEPALGIERFPLAPEWTSGHALAAGADLLIHDGQYTEDEYRDLVGYGHSSVPQAVAFARQAEVGMLQLFHHDPSHDDAAVDALAAAAAGIAGNALPVTAATEGSIVEL